MKEKETKVYKERKKKAQFFTPTQLVDRILQEAEIPFENKTILEPSCGDGVFIEQLIENNEIYAIDKDKNKTKAIKEKYQTAKVITKDFLQYNPKIKFDVVIGNPPFNLPTDQKYVDTTEGFVSHAIDLLKDDGYLIFILPNTVLRNKKYQNLRKKIIENTQIYKIIDTRKNDFLGADIETIALFLKKGQVDVQRYQYKSKNIDRMVTLTRNARDTIKINNDTISNEIVNMIGTSRLSEIFDIYRGTSNLEQSLRGKNINFYNDTILTQGDKYYIGLQNIAYRLVANVIRGDDKEISDTITILKPKENMTYEQLCYIANFLDTPIANYMIHVNALNDSKLTIHIDKYYIEDICIPNIQQINEQEINALIENLEPLRNDRQFAEVRNEFFYENYGINGELRKEIETMWQFPKYKKKRMEIVYGI